MVLLVLLSTGISGCIEGGDDEDSGGSGDSSSVDIDETGGYINPENLPISLNFPENALSGSTKISIKKIDELPEKEGLIEDLGFDFSPDGTVFNEPVKLEMDYSEVDLPEGVEEYMLGIFKIEDGKFKLIQDCEVDPEKKIIKGKIITFSKYVAIGEKVGFILHTNKNRIANDNMDEWIFTCQLKLKKEGDTSEPTGDPLANTWMELDTYALSLGGETVGKGDPIRMTSDENGFIRGKTVATTNPNLRYGIAEFTLRENIIAIVVVDVGFDWPYFNHFNETLVGEEWERYEIVMDGQDRTHIGPKPLSIETSPNGKEKFLGPFTTDIIVLKLENIPHHYRIIVEFDFIAIGPWKNSAEDQTWSEALNDPNTTWGHCCSRHVTLQEDPNLNDVSNSLGYDTAPLIYTDGNDEVTLERGDRIIPVNGYIQNHFSDFIELGITVDERGFGEDSDEGQYWGIDNIYVRYVSGDD